ncbi:MAG TPA: hypothetical protein VFS32_05525, partial [Candidatus Limnocylindrales bacterium]|nr:hypothetical protein [Candidatus Limnocylindrales bacterium]
AAPVLTDLWVTGSASHPDGTLHVLALVQAPPADRPDTVDAVVHFATGDFPMTLTRSGQGVAYHGDATVPVNEPTGEVAIDVSGDVAGQTLTGTGWGKVLAVGDGSVNATSEDTQGSDGTEGTDGTDGTEDTQGTDGTEGTDGTDGTDGTTTDGDTTGSPDQVVVSADFVRQVIALLESLLA